MTGHPGATAVRIAGSHFVPDEMPFLQNLTQFDFHHRLAATSGPALVCFTAPACGACKRLRQVLGGTSWGPLALFEVDAGRDLALTREFEVFHLPAMFLFVDGRFHCELQAEATPDHLRHAIDAALRAPAQEAP